MTKRQVGKKSKACTQTQGVLPAQCPQPTRQPIAIDEATEEHVTQLGPFAQFSPQQIAEAAKFADSQTAMLLESLAPQLQGLVDMAQAAVSMVKTNVVEDADSSSSVATSEVLNRVNIAMSTAEELEKATCALAGCLPGSPDPSQLKLLMQQLDNSLAGTGTTLTLDAGTGFTTNSNSIAFPKWVKQQPASRGLPVTSTQITLAGARGPQKGGPFAIKSALPPRPRKGPQNPAIIETTGPQANVTGPQPGPCEAPSDTGTAATSTGGAARPQPNVTGAQPGPCEAPSNSGTAAGTTGGAAGPPEGHLKPVVDPNTRVSPALAARLRQFVKEVQELADRSESEGWEDFSEQNVDDETAVPFPTIKIQCGVAADQGNVEQKGNAVRQEQRQQQGTDASTDWQKEHELLMEELQALRKHREWADSRIQQFISKAKTEQKPLHTETAKLKGEVCQLRAEKEAMEAKLKEFERSLTKLKDSTYKEAIAKRQYERRVQVAEAELRGATLRDQELETQLRDTHAQLAKEKKKREGLERLAKKAETERAETMTQLATISSENKSLKASMQTYRKLAEERSALVEELKAELAEGTRAQQLQQEETTKELKALRAQVQQAEQLRGRVAAMETALAEDRLREQALCAALRAAEASAAQAAAELAATQQQLRASSISTSSPERTTPDQEHDDASPLYSHWDGSSLFSSMSVGLGIGGTAAVFAGSQKGLHTMVHQSNPLA